ncbi:hypothetical protein PRIPAC_95319 [Pristionchus pacificus]|uniref:G protein-coupled receptor n=1 Tax=Pristionchus pacificus TaxID=54126 RepID=A0A2A6D2Y5_PRIPA|nr:hypothetical protein PRIPAC_95319 [Pristionchus pacificus]|eukprot:PDM84804.1 G protein-coupled receptor [Pristionchus pacificus]
MAYSNVRAYATIRYYSRNDHCSGNGLPCFIYLVLNRAVRDEFWKMLIRKSNTTMSLLLFFTYLIGIIGISSNVVLITAVRKHTPSTLRVYATIFLASALCDSLGLFTMIFTTGREVIYNGSCVMEFHGACTLFPDEICWAAWGLQEQMYCTAVSLLCLSFAYRFLSFEESKFTRRWVVISLIIGTIVINSHVVPGYLIILANVRVRVSYMENYRQQRSDAVSSSLGLIYTPDSLTSVVLSYTILASLVCFSIVVILRKLTIQHVSALESTMSSNAKSHQKMLSEVKYETFCEDTTLTLSFFKALNVQLAASSFFFIGCIIFTINLSYDSLEIAFISVPIANLQNVCTPISTLYLITPYRRFITQFLPSRMQSTLESSNSVNTSSTVNLNLSQQEAIII